MDAAIDNMRDTSPSEKQARNFIATSSDVSEFAVRGRLSIAGLSRMVPRSCARETRGVKEKAIPPGTRNRPEVCHELEVLGSGEYRLPGTVNVRGAESPWHITVRERVLPGCPSSGCVLRCIPPLPVSTSLALSGCIRQRRGGRRRLRRAELRNALLLLLQHARS